MSTPIGGPIGYSPRNVDIDAINRTGATLAIGDVLQLDLAQSDGDVSNNTQGDENSGLANLILPAAATAGRLLVVALATTANDGKGKFRLKGRCKCNVLNSDTGTIGGGMTVTTAGLFDATIVAGEVVWGFFLEVTGALDTELNLDCIFDGENGFGIRHA
tara:strand:- start:44635 stop:45114 length:480 start_codon:yes stop_codon:yes gene_type:complete